MRRVRLLDVAPELAAGLTADVVERARRTIIVDLEHLEPGPWQPDRAVPEHAHLGFMIVEGMMVRPLSVAGSQSVELLSEGDLLRPWQEDAASFTDATWRCLTPVTLVSLGGAAARSICRWPPLISMLIERALHRSRSLVVQKAIQNTVGLESRVMLLFWHAAERWGTRTGDGVDVPLELTHETIGLLVGARRPSVSAAVNALARDDRLVRDGSKWLVRGDPPGVGPAGRARPGNRVGAQG